METVDLVVGLLLLVGLAGVVVPILPGLLLVAVALVGWAVVVEDTVAWAYAGVGLLLVALGTVLKYAVPGRRLLTSGVPRSTLLLGGVAAVVGFFVVPVLGLVLGFVLGVYLAEVRRLGRASAWPSTKATLLAVGLSIMIELSAGLAATVVWAVGAWTT